ncbi:hypothetical protein Dsin_002231, partial [Dipteronia sinensis]
MDKCMLVHYNYNLDTTTMASRREVSDRIDRIRDALSWIGNSNPRLQDFNRYCTNRYA